MNIYERAMNTLIEKNTIDGHEMPDWLKKVKLVFEWGRHFGLIVEKAQKGELADAIMDILPHELIGF